jgi:hypothetical protein
MMKLKPNALKWALPLLATGFLMYTDGVLAADFANDAQTQAREVLRGNAARGAGSLAPAKRISASTVDAQLGARLVILGNPTPAGVQIRSALQVNAMPVVSFPRKHGLREYTDAQEQAHRLIRGGAA